MFRYIGIGLLGLFVVLIMPAQIEFISNDLEFGGYLTVAKYDENGNNVFTQTLHNRLVDTGETFLLQQVFQEGTAVGADNIQIGAICLTDEIAISISETMTAAAFDAGNAITETNCIEDTAVDLSGGQTAVIGPVTFSAGTHVAAGDTITAVGICQSNSAGGNDFNDCTTTGILFAVVDIPDFTLNSGETADITYTFDMSSPATWEAFLVSFHFEKMNRFLNAKTILIM